MKPTEHRVGWPTGRRAPTTILAICILAGIALAAGAVSATPSTELEALSTTPDGVTVEIGPLSVPSDGSFAIDVGVEVPDPTSYLEVRLQIRRPSGRLLFQRTEVRSDVDTGTVEVEFSRELADLELRPDAYPYEIRVRMQADEVVEKVAAGFLLVHEPNPEITPVALAVRISSTPRFDPQGNLVSDPSRSTGALEQAEALAQAVLDDPTLRLSLAIAPVTLDEWSRISQGFMLSETDAGLVEVASDEPGPVRYAAALGTLRDALATGRLELLDVPYADPDVVALAATERLDDLEAHYALGLSTYLAALESTPSAGTAVAADALPGPAFEMLEKRDIRFALIAPRSPGEAAVESTGAGIYSIEGSTVDALVLHTAIVQALDEGESSAGAVLAFRHAISEDAAMPVVTLTDLGPGRTGSVQSVIELAALMNEAVWAQLVTTTQAAETPSSDTYEPPASLEVTPTPPAGYWEEVAEARRYAAALEYAAGADDPDARQATESSLVAQSARWAGADGSWSMADRGRAFASTAERISHSILDTVSLTTKDVTLAGPRGEVPISIVNGSAKDLQVVLKIRADDMIVTSGGEEVLALRPQENFHTVAVDLRSLLADTLVVELWADDVMLASGSSVVRASYLDRLALVAGAVVILLGILFYIRKRVRAADAGNMPSQTDQTSGEGTTS